MALKGLDAAVPFSYGIYDNNPLWLLVLEYLLNQTLGWFKQKSWGIYLERIIIYYALVVPSELTVISN